MNFQRKIKHLSANILNALDNALFSAADWMKGIRFMRPIGLIGRIRHIGLLSPARLVSQFARAGANTLAFWYYLLRYFAGEAFLRLPFYPAKRLGRMLRKHNQPQARSFEPNFIKFFVSHNRAVALVLSVIFIAGGVLVYFTLTTEQTTEAAWYDNNWTYRKQIDVDPQKVIKTATESWGSTSTGTTWNSSTANYMYIIPLTSSRNGTVTNLQVRTSATASFWNPRFKGIITDSSYNILTNGISDIVTITGTNGEQWYTATFATPPSITSGATYYIGFVAEDGNMYFRSTYTTGYHHANSFATPTNPTSPTSNYILLSTYANISYTENMANFPMLVSLTDPDLKVTGSGGKVASSTAGDLLFVDWEGNKLDHEIESYTSTTGALQAWVKMPFMSSTSTRSAYLYFGNANATYQPTNSAVWDSNYKGVWHLPNGTTLTTNDSTSNGKNGTNNNGVTAGTGQIDGAASFNNASSQSISLPSSTFGSGSVTVELWTKFNNLTSYWPMFSAYTSDADSIEIFVDSAARLFGGNYTNRALSSTNLVTNRWYHIVLTAISGGVTQFYINGEASGTTGTMNFATYTVAPNIGRRASYYYNDVIDEVRVSSGIARSVPWIQTEYNNQSNPTTFYTVSGLQAVTQRDKSDNPVPAVKLRGGVKVRGGVKFRLLDVFLHLNADNPRRKYDQ